MSWTRAASTLGAAAVAAIAAWSSWSHMVHVALRYGERPEVAYALPLSVDGLLVVASAAMVDDKRAGRTPRTSARVAFLVGVVASLAANVAAAEPSHGARIVAGWPALALLLAVELLSRRGRPLADRPAARSTELAEVAAETSIPVASAVRRPRANAADRVAKAVARTPDATPAAVAARLSLSERTVQRHWPRAADDMATTPDRTSTQVPAQIKRTGEAGPVTVPAAVNGTRVETLAVTR